MLKTNLFYCFNRLLATFKEDLKKFINADFWKPTELRITIFWQKRGSERSDSNHLPKNCCKDNYQFPAVLAHNATAQLIEQRINLGFILLKDLSEIT